MNNNRISEDMISYYDLLTLLKNNKQPKEVELNIMNYKALYIFDADNIYLKIYLLKIIFLIHF